MENNCGENIDIRLCFPRYGEKSDGKLIDIINKTKESLDIAVFNFTDRKILKAILEAKDQNVAIRIITDKIMSLTPIQFFILRKLKRAGIPIKKNSHPGFMHLKITIADQKVVTAASANFTKASQNKNDEFFMSIRDEKMASEFIKQFDLMWNKTGDFHPF
jgi:phosphatidylserine/phosphatidylglycerophosphate/cardiolipin synthase-like enzyme